MAAARGEWRLFVAAYPPAASAKGFLECLPRDIDEEWRRTRREQIHLTVFFIGNVAKNALEATLESVERSCSGVPAFSLQPERVATLPEKGPKRVLVVTTEAPASLLEIRGRLVQRLARMARVKPNDRFLPHFTVARARRPTNRPIDAPVELPPLEIHELRLMRSVLTPDGAEHRLVRAFPLSGMAQG